MPRHLLRLVVPSPDRRRVLARPNGLAGWSLPVVAAEDPTAWTGGADAAARRALGAALGPVRRLDPRTWELEPLGRIPAVGTAWIGWDEAARLGADADAATTWSRAEASPPRSPHLRPGWRGELRRWLAETLDEPAHDGIGVLRHWEPAAVLSVPTRSGTVVVKECGVGFTREAGVVAALDGLPGAPALVAADGARFVTRWAGPTGAARPTAVAAALGALQRGATERVPELRAAGCRDAGATAASVGGAVADALDRVESLGLAHSVVHGDAQASNAVGIDEVVVVDWSDATIGSPAIDLDLLLGHGDHHPGVVEAWCATLGHDPAPVAAALPAIRTVAAALAVALHRERRDELPEVVLPAWDAWTRARETRLDQLLS